MNGCLTLYHLRAVYPFTAHQAWAKTALSYRQAVKQPNGLVLCGLASTQYPQPAQSNDVTVIRYPDGAQTEYNHTNGQLKLSGIKTVHIQAHDSLTLDCPQNTVKGALTVQGLLTYQAGMAGSNGEGGSTTIEGDFTHKGNFTNMGKVSSNGVILDEHTHPETNRAQTGVPT